MGINEGGYLPCSHTSAAMPTSATADQPVTMAVTIHDMAQKTAALSISFSESRGDTNMVIRTWNAAGQIAEMHVFGALDVVVHVDPGPEAGVVNPEPTAIVDVTVPHPMAGSRDAADHAMRAIRMWSDFVSEFTSDIQPLTSLGLDYSGADMSDCVMTHFGSMVVKKGIAVE